MNAALRAALTDAAYADASGRLGPGIVPTSAEAWVELRAASAVLQTHGGHPMPSVYEFLSDMAAFPPRFGSPPPDLRERLLFAYAFLLATGDTTTPNKDTP